MAELIDCRTAFEACLASFIWTARQREIGRRRLVGRLPCVSYRYTWEGELVEADNFFVFDLAPEEVLGTLAAADLAPAPKGSPVLLVAGPQPAELAAYLRAGYEVGWTEYLMARCGPGPAAGHELYRRLGYADLAPVAGLVRAAAPGQGRG